MSRRLGEIEPAIGEARYLTLGSVQNTLAMPAAAGMELAGPSESDYQRFNGALGPHAGAGRPPLGRVAGRAGGAGPHDLRTLRAMLYDMILTRVGDYLRSTGSRATQATSCACRGPHQGA